jgi:hypothetical protein
MEKNIIQQQRCENDPIYAILYDPDFLDELLKLCILVVYKKYGSTFKNDPSLSHVFHLLQNTKDDSIKRIAVIFFIVWESDIHHAVKNMYGDEGIFQKNGKLHFEKFVVKMEEFVDKTIKFAYSKYNIIHVVNNFDTGIKKEYLMGPFE